MVTAIADNGTAAEPEVGAAAEVEVAGAIEKGGDLWKDGRQLQGEGANTSSVTSPDEKRRKTANASADDEGSDQPANRGPGDEEMVEEDDKEVGGD